MSRELIKKVAQEMDQTDIRWRKSGYSASNGGNCVEVAGVNSTDPDAPFFH